MRRSATCCVSQQHRDMPRSDRALVVATRGERFVPTARGRPRPLVHRARRSSPRVQASALRAGRTRSGDDEDRTRTRTRPRAHSCQSGRPPRRGRAGRPAHRGRGRPLPARPPVLGLRARRDQARAIAFPSSSSGSTCASTAAISAPTSTRSAPNPSASPAVVDRQPPCRGSVDRTREQGEPHAKEVKVARRKISDRVSCSRAASAARCGSAAGVRTCCSRSGSDRTSAAVAGARLRGGAADAARRAGAAGRTASAGESGSEQAGSLRSTFGTFVEQQWKPLVFPTFKASTQHGYKTVLANHVLPAWKDWRLRDIERLAIQQWVADKFAGRTRAGRRCAMRGCCCRAFSRAAVEYGYLQTNPARGVKFPQKGLKEKPAMIAGDSLAKLLDAARRTVSDDGAADRGDGTAHRRAAGAAVVGARSRRSARWRCGNRCSRASSSRRRHGRRCGRFRLGRTRSRRSSQHRERVDAGRSRTISCSAIARANRCGSRSC